MLNSRYVHGHDHVIIYIHSGLHPPINLLQASLSSPPPIKEKLFPSNQENENSSQFRYLMFQLFRSMISCSEWLASKPSSHHFGAFSCTFLQKVTPAELFDNLELYIEGQSVACVPADSHYLLHATCLNWMWSGEGTRVLRGCKGLDLGIQLCSYKKTSMLAR